MRSFLMRYVVACICWVAVVDWSTTASAQMGPVKVTVVEVIERDLASGRAFVGTVVARRHSSVGSAVSGRVEEFLVNEGEAVTKDQPLAKLKTRNIEIQIAAAKAEFQLRQHELQELKNGAREEELRESEARMKAADAARKLAAAKLLRVKGLIERNAATREEIEDVSGASETASAMHLAAKAAYDLVIAGPRPEKIAQAQARADAAKEEINRLEDILDKHTIKSPFDGFVVAEHTEEGQWIESGRLVAEIVEVNPIEVRVAVQESYVPRLSLKMLAKVDVEAIPGQSFDGTVTAIVPKADEKSRTFPVRVTLKNPQQADGTPLLKPGMFAKVELPVDQKNHVLLVPKDSLVLGGPKPVIYVVALDDKTKVKTARPVTVQIGISLNSWIEVTGELKPGQEVVVEGNERLRLGVEVVTEAAKIQPPKSTAGKTRVPKPATNLSEAPSATSPAE